METMPASNQVDDVLLYLDILLRLMYQSYFPKDIPYNLQDLLVALDMHYRNIIQITHVTVNNSNCLAEFD